ncbi:peptidylprolyl isomerase [Avibacterium paragallinarum]|uniref:Periplasmic chaperone PpiD n=1 Tax=Avibacterium paragallinarum TaxID=728 RepID=A0A0F5EZL0_AVIPA|nr:peptidylprolyl isomerase [Avibacterium paragallinarum]KAA6209092.1 peptidylprolyl isomerase [Avibacterium paragallinarum]KKB02018.1 peptidylprolyl isomerase [Avibacterium paragallinarum]MEE3609180.1 peptidylprolyl isomerase [Avibacterium paragallinarum]MEE3621254.1 peptidylprolyl isomerase [Avibacterium paragallinarum]MEE3669332.1 peptidylprolyl isomerase [Avibacterium paragallinarum]
MLMEKLSDASNSILWKIIFALIVVSFVLSGVAGYMFTRVDTFAAKVNGEEISQQLFLEQYNQESQRISQQMGTSFAAVADSPEFVQQLRSTILQRLIDEQLLRQYSQELKLDISDEQIEQAIVTSPIFQKEGKFDNRLYQQILENNQLTGERYAQYLREGLRLQQLNDGLVQSVFTVPSQSDTFAKLFFQQRDVRLLQFPLAATIAQQQVSEEEIATYYNANKSAFAVPELVKVQYLDLTKQAAEKNVNVTDVEVAQYYQDNKAQYMVQHLAHIQLSTEKEAQAVYEDLQKGESFASLAKRYSIDKISGSNGGDLDWVVAGMMPPQFEAVARELKVGEYSQPVKVDNTYHIIKVEDEKFLPLSEVKNDIVAKLRNELSAKAFYAMERQANEKVFEQPDSLQAAAQTAGVSVQETGYFPRNEIPAALNYGNVVSAIFDSELNQGGTNSEAINVGEQHSLIIRVVDHKPEGVKTLAEAKDQIIQYLKQQKAEQIVLAQAEKVAQSLTENSDATLPDGVQFGETEQWVYAENKHPQLRDVIFAMRKPADKPIYMAAKNGDNGIVVIELINVKDGELSPEQLKQFDMQLQQTQQIELQQTLLQALRAKAKIEINQAFLTQQE